MKRVLCGVGAVAALLATVLSPVASHAAAGWAREAKAANPVTPVQHQGYIRMADGARLEYTVDLPRSNGRFPVAMVYDGYCEGVGPLACNDVQAGTALLNAGFAVLGVSVRGTSCSSGTFDAFTKHESRDGVAAIEWAAKQPWSDGHLGTFGDSFPGITQMGIASLRPAHLDAIAPWQVTTDLYRDVAYPGGITNVGFGAFWAGIDQPLNSYKSGATYALQSKDPRCLQSLAENLAKVPQHNVALQGLFHPNEDGFWKAREPGLHESRIDVPTLACQTWQDDEVSSRAVSMLDVLDPQRTWAVLSNGYHGMCDLSTPRVTRELVAFFDHFVKGDANGFARTPHIQIWHDTTTNRKGMNVPSWVTTGRSYPSMPVRPLPLYFRSNGALSLKRPTTDAAPDHYAYPGPSLGSEDGVVAGQHNLLWKGAEPSGASLSYTTPTLRHDAEFLGSGSANLWVSSTAPDTDLQITLTDVRPDGQEEYVARGWLQASHRALNAKKSTRLAPYQIDTKATSRPLPVGQPTRMRLQLGPSDHVFRKGSRLRLWIDAPTGLTGGWSLNFLKAPAINSVYADRRHPSEIVLGYLPGGHAEGAQSTCDTVLNEPCRPSTGTAPGGKLRL
jgi:hypothetical protein